MSFSDVTRSQRWQHLINAAFHLGEVEAKGAERALAAAVDSGLEVFGHQIDPVDDFEGYAVRRFLLALREALRSA